jgi:DNA-binding XRE family transcriptional regulator
MPNIERHDPNLLGGMGCDVGQSEPRGETGKGDNLRSKAGSLQSGHELSMQSKRQFVENHCLKVDCWRTIKIPALALLGIVQRQIHTKWKPANGRVVNRKPLCTPSRTVGDCIRYARKLKGLTQRQLAINAGVSRWRVHQMENNIVAPTPEEILNIELTLGGETLLINAEGQQ